MRVWLITVGEPLPVDVGEQRLLRAGILAQTLTSLGHEVLWWSSTFDHVLKTFRARALTDILVSPGFRIRLLHSVGYKRNVSIRRLLNHRGIARQFKKFSLLESPPDVILCSFPTIELSEAAVRYGLVRGVPVVLDVRDQWPDIFLNIVPERCRVFARPFLFSLFRSARAAFSKATAITGVTDKFVEWGIRCSNRPRSELDDAFPMAYTAQVPSPDALAAAEAFWDEQGVQRDGRFIICFFGTLGRQFELESVIETARCLANENVLFVICGTGDRIQRYRKLAEGCANVLLPGWVDAPQIWVLMRRAAMGLAPYHNEPNFTENLPNKCLEYLSAGLPILSCLRGELAQLLAQHHCGVTYEYRDPHDLREKVLRAKNNSDDLAQMSRNAHALFRERFSAAKVYAEMTRYLEGVVESHARTRRVNR